MRGKRKKGTGGREMGRRRKKGKGYGERRRRLKTVEKGNGTVKKKLKKIMGKLEGNGIGGWENG
jgi:hypothetical protein